MLAKLFFPSLFLFLCGFLPCDEIGSWLASKRCPSFSHRAELLLLLSSFSSSCFFFPLLLSLASRSSFLFLVFFLLLLLLLLPPPTAWAKPTPCVSLAPLSSPRRQTRRKKTKEEEEEDKRERSWLALQCEESSFAQPDGGKN